MSMTSDSIFELQSAMSAMLKALANAWDKTSAEFSVRIDDADLGEYGVNCKWYCDADRAGFSDYITESVVGNLSQTEASELARALNEEIKRRRDRRRAWRSDDDGYGRKIPSTLSLADHQMFGSGN